MSGSTVARVDAPAKAVKAGDVVTVALDARVRVLKVTGFAERRGAAEAGRALYEDLAPVAADASGREPAPPELVAPRGFRRRPADQAGAARHRAIHRAR